MYLVKIDFHGTGFLAVKAAVEAVVGLSIDDDEAVIDDDEAVIAFVLLSIDDEEAVIAGGVIGFSVEVEFEISLATDSIFVGLYSIS